MQAMIPAEIDKAEPCHILDLIDTVYIAWQIDAFIVKKCQTARFAAFLPRGLSTIRREIIIKHKVKTWPNLADACSPTAFSVSTDRVIRVRLSGHGRTNLREFANPSDGYTTYYSQHGHQRYCCAHCSTLLREDSKL